MNAATFFAARRGAILFDLTDVAVGMGQTVHDSPFLTSRQPSDRSLRAQGWRVLRIWEHALGRQNERRLLAASPRSSPRFSSTA